MATKLSPHENHSAYYTVQALRGLAIKKNPTHFNFILNAKFPNSFEHGIISPLCGSIAFLRTLKKHF